MSPKRSNLMRKIDAFLQWLYDELAKNPKIWNKVIDEYWQPDDQEPKNGRPLTNRLYL